MHQYIHRKMEWRWNYNCCVYTAVEMTKSNSSRLLDILLTIGTIMILQWFLRPLIDYNILVRRNKDESRISDVYYVEGRWKARDLIHTIHCRSVTLPSLFDAVQLISEISIINRSDWDSVSKTEKWDELLDISVVVPAFNEVKVILLL